jgi:hypothetical protein
MFVQRRPRQEIVPDLVGAGVERRAGFQEAFLLDELFDSRFFCFFVCENGQIFRALPPEQGQGCGGALW